MREELARARRVLAPSLPGFGGTPPPAGRETSRPRRRTSSRRRSRPGSTGRSSAGSRWAGTSSSSCCAERRSAWPGSSSATRGPRRIRRKGGRPATPPSRWWRRAAARSSSAGSCRGWRPRRRWPTRPFGAPGTRWETAASDEGLCAALEALRDRPDSRPLLAAIRVPTLVVVGEEDAVTPPAVAESMQRAIPGSRLEVIPGAGHLVPMEQPAAFTARWSRSCGTPSCSCRHPHHGRGGGLPLRTRGAWPALRLGPIPSWDSRASGA